MKKILLNIIKSNSPDYKKHYAFVDDEDYEKLSQYSWHVQRSESGRLYAVTNIKVKNGYKSLKMHKLITGYKQTDHLDNDGLNNQKNNLREATHSQNNWNKSFRRDNKSGLKGVHWDNSLKKWKAQIGYKGKRIHLGLFADKSIAGIVYDINAIALFGEFAKLNFGGTNAN